MSGKTNKVQNSFFLTFIFEPSINVLPHEQNLQTTNTTRLAIMDAPSSNPDSVSEHMDDAELDSVSATFKIFLLEKCFPELDIIYYKQTNQEIFDSCLVFFLYIQKTSNCTPAFIKSTIRAAAWLCRSVVTLIDDRLAVLQQTKDRSPPKVVLGSRTDWNPSFLLFVASLLYVRAKHTNKWNEHGPMSRSFLTAFSANLKDAVKPLKEQIQLLAHVIAEFEAERGGSSIKKRLEVSNLPAPHPEVLNLPLPVVSTVTSPDRPVEV